MAATGIIILFPPSNPFVGIPGILPEIWATGLRNPWRFSFDKLSGNMWIGDVGEQEWEEINFQPAGRAGVNYGWSCWEGAHFFKDNCDANAKPVTFPVAEYEHTITSGTCAGSITGGFVYRGTQFPSMYGKYIYADFCKGTFRAVYKDHGVWVNRFLATKDAHAYTSFGEKKNGELYVTDYNTGNIYHLIDETPAPRFISDYNAEENETEKGVTLFPNPNTGEFTVQLNASRKENCSIIISDQLGQQVLTDVKSLEEGFNEWTFSSDKFTPGMYIFQVKASGANISKRFSVQ